MLTIKQLGRFINSRELLALLKTNKITKNDAKNLIIKHMNLDFGEITEDDRFMNKACISHNEGIVMSRFTVNGVELIVFTKLNELTMITTITEDELRKDLNLN